MFSIDEIKAKFTNLAEQKSVLDWTEKALRPLANCAAYVQLCQGDEFILTPEILKAVHERLKPLADGGTPGHDKGHHERDLLGVAAIVGSDPTVAKAYWNDIVAGFLAGAYHDVACAVVSRYKDNDGWLGHAECGAWIFFHQTEDLLPENIRLLAAYAIACHTHALKPVTTKIGYTRQPWEDSLFYQLGHPIRIAVWLTRFADRLDTNGVTLLARHIVANLDSYVYNGQDFSGDKWYTINDKALELLIKPEAVLDGTTPSALLHIARFAGSNDQSKIGAYNQHDSLFPIMSRLITAKSVQAVKLGEAIGKNELSIADSLKKKPATNGEDLFWTFLTRVSDTDIETVHKDFTELWSHLTPKEQQKWVAGIKFASDEYDSWVSALKYRVRHSTNPMFKALVTTVMEIVSL